MLKEDDTLLSFFCLGVKVVIMMHNYTFTRNDNRLHAVCEHCKFPASLACII